MPEVTLRACQVLTYHCYYIVNSQVAKTLKPLLVPTSTNAPQEVAVVIVLRKRASTRKEVTGKT